MTNNLFAIDIEAVLRAVEDANKPIVDQHKALMGALDRVPVRLETEEEVNRAKRFVGQLEGANKKSRRVRLEETKPIRELLKKVDGFFKKMENEAADARKVVLDKLSDAGRRLNTPRRLDPDEYQETKANETIITNPQTGEVNGTVFSRSSKLMADEDLIPLTWRVSQIDHDNVDLEALHPFISETAILNAACGHMREHGPNVLRGVKYTQEANL